MSRPRRTDTTATAESAQADQRELRALSDAGAVLGTPRLVQHYLVCATRQGAATATLQLREAGFEASRFENPTAAGWIIVAERVETVDEETMAMSRSLLELVASRCAADYDGWRTELLEAEVGTGPAAGTSPRT